MLHAFLSVWPPALVYLLCIVWCDFCPKWFKLVILNRAERSCFWFKHIKKPWLKQVSTVVMSAWTLMCWLKNRSCYKQNWAVQPVYPVNWEHSQRGLKSRAAVFLSNSQSGFINIHHYSTALILNKMSNEQMMWCLQRNDLPDWEQAKKKWERDSLRENWVLRSQYHYLTLFSLKERAIIDLLTW